MPPAQHELERIPERYTTSILDFLPTIAANPRRLGKPLRLEWEGHLAARRGPYRIIYALDHKTRTVRVVAVAHRAHVYRRR
jgi:mRNA-degrading endonuclease RelE of RelBE toxin-antitoxin system